MENKAIVDKIYAALLSLSSNPDHDLGKFTGRWGYKSSDQYQNNMMDFVEKVRGLAMECPIKSYNGKFFLYDGRIYIAISDDLVEMAFDLLMIHLRIAPMVGNKNFCRQYFVKVISYYNLLRPRSDLIAFRNGVFDLRDYTLHEFSPDYHVTYIHEYDFNERAKCNKWHSFLHEVLPDKNSRVILQMFLGLGLMERSSVYRKYVGKDVAKVELCLILIGSGSNGKSTITNTAIGIFGKENITSLDYDDLTASGDEGMRNRVALHNALFNWSSDSDQRTFGRKRTGVFKRLVSGESVTSRKIGEDVKEKYDIPFLIFNLNEMPSSDDQSLGFIRRLQFVRFEYIVPKNKQNPALERELVAEYPGIFQWILRGCKELKRKKFIFPSSEGSRRQLMLAQLQINPVLAWVNAYQMRWDMRARNENYEYIKAKDMMESLERFCQDNNVEMVSKQKFGHTMSRIGNGFHKKHSPDGLVYQVYGCTAERLKIPFVIEEANMAVEYIQEKDSFIKEDD